MTAKFTIILAGPPKSGKTRLVRHLAKFIDPADLVTVYDGDDSYQLPPTAEPAPGDQAREVTIAVVPMKAIECGRFSGHHDLDHTCILGVNRRETIPRGVHVFGCEHCGAMFQFDWGVEPPERRAERSNAPTVQLPGEPE